MIDHKKYFDAATSKILDQVDRLNGTSDAIRYRHDMIISLRDSMMDPHIRRKMVPTFHQMNFYPSRGFCEIASLLWLYHMGDAWDLMQIRGTDWSHGPHFYTRHRISGQIIDITVDQYSVRHMTVPYHLGQCVEIDRRRKKLLDMYLECLHLQNK